METTRIIPCAWCNQPIELVWKPEHASHDFYHGNCYTEWKQQQ